MRWQALEDLGLTLSATHYGQIKASNRNFRGGEIPETEQVPRDPYTTLDFSLDYEVNDNMRLTAGVNNLINTREFATAGGPGNANTFNEPGRSFYLSLTGTF